MKSKDFLVSSSEVTSESPVIGSAWKTCARKTGIGSYGRIVASVGAKGRTRGTSWTSTQSLEPRVEMAMKVELTWLSESECIRMFLVTRQNEL